MPYGVFLTVPIKEEHYWAMMAYSREVLSTSKLYSWSFGVVHLEISVNVPDVN